MDGAPWESDFSLSANLFEHVPVLDMSMLLFDMQVKIFGEESSSL